MSGEALPDISDPEVAARLGSELAGDLLYSVGGGLLAIPLHARIAFFQAYLARLIGGMKVALGNTHTEIALDQVATALFSPPEEAKPRLH